MTSNKIVPILKKESFENEWQSKSSLPKTTEDYSIEDQLSDRSKKFVSNMLVSSVGLRYINFRFLFDKIRDK